MTEPTCAKSDLPSSMCAHCREVGPVRTTYRNPWPTICPLCDRPINPGDAVEMWDLEQMGIHYNHPECRR
jgi:hypothetical protein